MPGLIVHEWIEKTGGAEKVVDAMLNEYRDADLYCLWNDHPKKYQNNTVYQSVLARTPIRRNKPLAAIAAPVVWRNAKVSTQYDWLLVSSHLFAHQVRFTGANRDIPKFVYVHTPARYVWNPELDPRGAGRRARIASAVLKPLDRKYAGELNNVAANSAFVRDRIRKAWGIEATVIHPPVDVERITSIGSWQETLCLEDSESYNKLPEEFILGASRFVPYKQLDAVIAAGDVAGVPVVLAGAGPDEARLRHLASGAKVPVHFVLSPSDALLFALYQKARAYVFPAIEDFGIMPVEAMAAGAPVIVNAIGGSAETVVHGETGMHLSRFDRESIVGALKATDDMVRQRSIARAKAFSKEQFQAHLRAWVEV